MHPPASAPVDMVAAPTWQWVFGSLHFGLAALTIYLAARGPVRDRNGAELRFRMLVLFGGALGSVFFEGAIDRGGQLWYARSVLGTGRTSTASQCRSGSHRSTA